MNIFLCLKCKNINKVDIKSISVNNNKMIQCTKCYSKIEVEFISRSCCRLKYKFSLLDEDNNIIKVKYNSFPKR